MTRPCIIPTPGSSCCARAQAFCQQRYAATSVQHIVDDAKLSKPALYYHFKDKAGLFQALVHEAHDERYRLLCAAAASNTGIRAQLKPRSRAVRYFRENRELMRISFATMFAAPGEVPKTSAARRSASAILNSSTRYQARAEKRRAGPAF